MPLIESLSPAQLLAFVLVTLLMLAVLTWRLVLVLFRREPPGIFRRSFFDATGQPNGVLLTVFNAVLAINTLTICFIFTGKEPPVHVWATWGTIVLIGIGADTKVTLKQIETKKAAAVPDFAGATGCDSEPGATTISTANDSNSAGDSAASASLAPQP